jgi:hypothetical protein
MNKLLFHYDVHFGEDIILIANNHKDLEEYLEFELKYRNVRVTDTQAIFKENEWSDDTSVVELKWIKHI